MPFKFCLWLNYVNNTFVHTKIQMQKDLLFYSKFCKHSIDVINDITKRALRDNFMFISVDNPKFKIPDFIKVVPTILTYEKQILTGKNVNLYVESKSQTVNKASDEISPFTIGGTQYSAQYTWLSADGNGYDNDGSLLNNDQTRNNNFVLLNTDNHINISKDIEEDKSNKFDSSVYEKYISGRTNDDENIKKILDSDGRMPVR